MLDQVTILTALAYAIAKLACKGTGANAPAQLFGGAAGNFFHAPRKSIAVGNASSVSGIWIATNRRVCSEATRSRSGPRR